MTAMVLLYPETSIAKLVGPTITIFEEGASQSSKKRPATRLV
jgi:hypothetical protein